jgi:hypothetical protein
MIATENFSADSAVKNPERFRVLSFDTIEREQRIHANDCKKSLAIRENFPAFFPTYRPL